MEFMLIAGVSMYSINGVVNEAQLSLKKFLDFDKESGIFYHRGLSREILRNKFKNNLIYSILEVWKNGFSIKKYFY